MKFHTRLKDTVNSQCLLNEYMNKWVIPIPACLSSMLAFLSPLFFSLLLLKSYPKMNMNVPKVSERAPVSLSTGLKRKQEGCERMWNRAVCLAVRSVSAQGMEDAADKTPKCYQWSPRERRRTGGMPRGWRQANVLIVRKGTAWEPASFQIENEISLSGKVHKQIVKQIMRDSEKHRR